MAKAIKQITDKTTAISVLPLRDIVVFPHMIVPLFVGREKSIKALEAAMRDEKSILLLSQKDASHEEPLEEDMYKIGTLGAILQLLKLPDGTVKVLVEGRERAKVKKFNLNPDFFEADVEILPEEVGDLEELEATKRVVVGQFEQYIKLNRKTPPEILVVVNQIEDPSKLSDTIASHLVVKLSDKQALLENLVVSKRLENVYSLMESEIGLMQVEKRIRNRVKTPNGKKTQKEYYLNETIKGHSKRIG
jgi:ATP-dependent Lon protease